MFRAHALYQSYGGNGNNLKEFEAIKWEGERVEKASLLSAVNPSHSKVKAKYLMSYKTCVQVVTIVRQNT